MHGTYSSASWDISAELTDLVQAEELANRGRFCGTIHTHPAGTPDPSQQDLAATQRAIAANPAITSLLVCIVTAGEPRPTDVSVGTGFRMSIHVATRAPNDVIRVTRARAVVLPIAQDLHDAGMGDLPAGVAMHVEGLSVLAFPIPAGSSIESLAMVGFASAYPVAAPLFGTLADSQLTRAESPAWSPDRSRPQQLRAALASLASVAPHGQLDRVEPLAGRLSAKSVLIVGLGSVGSRFLDDLVRAGVGSFVLVDDDLVEAPNLARTTYTAADIGTPKVEAARRSAEAVNPAVRISAIPSKVQEVPDLLDLCDSVDLVIAASDDPPGQAHLSHHAYASGTPLVSVSLYKRAAAGEIVLSVPAYDTPCLSCAIGGFVSDEHPDQDYGTGRLVGELALGPAIHLVCEQAALLTIGLLAGPDRPAGSPVTELLAGNRSFAMVSSTPEWGVFKDVFAPLRKYQFAPQSIWPMVTRNSECPVCGDQRQQPDQMIGDRVAGVISRLRQQHGDSSVAQEA